MCSLAKDRTRKVCVRFVSGRNAVVMKCEGGLLTPINQKVKIHT